MAKKAKEGNIRVNLRAFISLQWPWINSIVNYKWYKWIKIWKKITAMEFWEEIGIMANMKLTIGMLYFLTNIKDCSRYDKPKL